MALMVSWQFDDLITTGPDPFPQSSSFNGDAIGASTFTIPTGSSGIDLEVNDDDLDFEDGDAGSQKLAADVTYNGVTYSAGDAVAVNYSYIVRPAGSTDPADEIQIYIVRVGGNAGDSTAIISDAQLLPGVTYDIVAQPEFADRPTASYDTLYVCLVEGTRIETPNGTKPVEALRIGDQLNTLDHGAQPIIWISRQEARFETPDDKGRPINIPSGGLGNGLPEHDLRVSPQHRILLRQLDGTEVLGPAKGLLGKGGVRVMRGVSRVVYYNFLLPRHGIIIANGAPVESFYPGAQAIKTLPETLKHDLFARYPALIQFPGTGYGKPARCLIKVRETRRLRSARLDSPGYRGCIRKVTAPGCQPMR